MRRGRSNQEARDVRKESKKQKARNSIGNIMMGGGYWEEKEEKIYTLYSEINKRENIQQKERGGGQVPWRFENDELTHLIGRYIIDK
jgi:hypothetical protein